MTDCPGNNPRDLSDILLARVHRVGHAKSSLPTKIIIGCLYIGCGVYVWLIAMILLYVSLGGGHGSPAEALCELFTQLLVLVGILCGVHYRHRWAWCAVLLIFAGCIFVGGIVFYFANVIAMLPFLLLGTLGLGCLFARNCRKEFGLSRS